MPCIEGVRRFTLATLSTKVVEGRIGSRTDPSSTARVGAIHRGKFEGGEVPLDPAQGRVEMNMKLAQLCNSRLPLISVLRAFSLRKELAPC